jgi:hypothetical protein
VFAFFAFREVEVEAYYEYKGVAPTNLAASIRHKFSTQTSHLASYARRLSALNHQKPTSTLRLTSTALPTSTATPIPTPTTVPTSTAAATLVPVPTSTATAVPTAIETSTPVPTPTQTMTPAPTGLVVQAAPQNPTYSVRDSATILVHALLNGKPPAGASVNVSFFFPGNSANCAGTVDANGNASCSVAVPFENPGTLIQVNVQVVATTGEVATTNTSFTIR